MSLKIHWPDNMDLNSYNQLMTDTEEWSLPRQHAYSLFNIYTNDQPICPNTRNFLNADSATLQSFKEVETLLTSDIGSLISYYLSTTFKPTLTRPKSVSSTYRTRKLIANSRSTGMSTSPSLSTLESLQTLTYTDHIATTKAKIKWRNNILKNLTNTKWGDHADTICTTALALCYSPAWNRSSHAKKIDHVLNTSYRSITGCLKPAKVNNLYLLSDIASPLALHKKDHSLPTGKVEAGKWLSSSTLQLSANDKEAQVKAQLFTLRRTNEQHSS